LAETEPFAALRGRTDYGLADFGELHVHQNHRFRRPEQESSYSFLSIFAGSNLAAARPGA
jgi:hypothetical protein